MLHPFSVLSSEYAGLLAHMQVTRSASIDVVAQKLIRFVRQGRYAEVSALTGIPQPWVSTSFEREASSNFTLSPAQGDPWDHVSTHVPKGRGPYPSWKAAALDAYHIDHLDQVGKENWTWERACYEGEVFNGMGYRSHGVHSPYLWAGTNIYTTGKFIADGKFDSGEEDRQLGIVPLMRRMVEIEPSVAFGRLIAPAVLPVTPTPLPAPEGLGGSEHDTIWLQVSLNVLLNLVPPLVADGSYGRHTRRAVIAFQQRAGLEVDGLAGPKTKAAIDAALAKLASLK